MYIEISIEELRWPKSNPKNKISRFPETRKFLTKILLGDPIEKFFRHFSGGFLKFVHLFLGDTRHNSDIPRALSTGNKNITVVTRLDLE
jgi:hypothetical protein